MILLNFKRISLGFMLGHLLLELTIFIKILAIGVPIRERKLGCGRLMTNTAIMLDVRYFFIYFSSSETGIMKGLHVGIDRGMALAVDVELDVDVEWF